MVQRVYGKEGAGCRSLVWRGSADGEHAVRDYLYSDEAMLGKSPSARAVRGTSHPGRGCWAVELPLELGYAKLKLKLCWNEE